MKPIAIILVIVSAALLGCAWPAVADLTDPRTASQSALVGGEVPLERLLDLSLGPAKPGVDMGRYESFRTERGRYLQTGAALRSVADVRMMPGEDLLDTQAGRTSLATGGASGRTYAIGSTRDASADALQGLLWTVEHSTTSRTTDWSAGAVRARFYQYTLAHEGTSTGSIRVLNLFDPSGLKKPNDVVVVPAPAGVVLGMIGLLLIGRVKRRLGC